MLSFWKTLSLRAKAAASFQPEGKREEPPDELCSSLDETIVRLRARFDNSSDLIVHELQVGGQRIALVACEGMVNLQVTAAGIVNPVSYTHLPWEKRDKTQELRDAVSKL